MNIRPVAPADTEPLGRMLARAFDDDPLFCTILPDTGRRQRALPVLFADWIRFLHLPYPGSFTTDGFEGAALWSPPGRWHIGLFTLLRTGPRALAALGSRTFAGLRILTAIERKHPTEPHHYLRLLGCDPECQGRGIGSRLLEPALAGFDERKEAAYLESSNEKNHSFYRRHGFETTAEVVTHLGARAWLMWRSPR